jgi:hypothetical protein
MITELDIVVLTKSLPEHGLEKGDVGSVVHVFGQGEAYEVEFVTLKGETAALVTLTSSEVRSVGKMDLLHVREANKTTLPLVA